MQHSIQQLLTQDAAKLAAALMLDPGSARIEVQTLLQQALNVSRAWLLARPEYSLNDSERILYAESLQRRLRGEPIAYILGEREFFGLMFKVTPATLIPRPETELLVELALQRIPSPASGRGFRILDLGAGSGAIALSIAHARPDIEVLAVDASAEALDVARENAQRLDTKNAQFMQSDWYAELGTQCFDLIVSNPPYVVADDPHLRQGDLRFEPASALASGDDGLKDIRHIVACSRAHLHPEGWLLLEHGYDQAESVRELLRQAGFGEVFSARDLSGIERASAARLMP